MVNELCTFVQNSFYKNKFWHFKIVDLREVDDKLTTFGAFKYDSKSSSTEKNCKLHNQFKNENYYCHVPCINFDCGEKEKKEKLLCQSFQKMEKWFFKIYLKKFHLVFLTNLSGDLMIVDVVVFIVFYFLHEI